MFLILFSRRWLLASIIVIAAVAVLARLGIWQLDRLEARRAFNARVIEQQNEEPLVLDATTINQDLYSMEYREVTVRGRYLTEDEIILRNQTWQGQLGFQLFTPLLIEGSNQLILVQRGWIPADQADPQHREIFAETELVSLSGLLRRAETDFGVQLRADPTLSPGQSRLDAWNHLDLERLSSQLDLPLLPVYLQRQPSDQEDQAPIAQALNLELSEGSHLGYAGQWFLFSLILGLGYPFFVKKQEQGKMAAPSQ
jgi:surfeit locus 1 family protein